MTADTIDVHPVRAVDLPAVVALLEDAGLPLAGLGTAEVWAVRDGDGSPAAVAALEVHGTVGLLRSLAVRSDRQGSGRGRQLVDHVVAQGRRRHLRAVYALTTTAHDYLTARGFRPIDRAETPSELDGSAELAGACPADARMLILELES